MHKSALVSWNMAPSPGVRLLVEKVKEGGRGSLMTIIAEHAEGHYEVEGVAHGKVYVWHSGQVVVDCGCGERHLLRQ